MPDNSGIEKDSVVDETDESSMSGGLEPAISLIQEFMSSPSGDRIASRPSHFHCFICRNPLATVPLWTQRHQSGRQVYYCKYYLGMYSSEPQRAFSGLKLGRVEGASVVRPGRVGWRVEDVDDRAKVRSSGGRVVVFVNESVEHLETAASRWWVQNQVQLECDWLSCMSRDSQRRDLGGIRRSMTS